MAQEEFMTDGKITGVIDHVYDAETITFKDGKEKLKLAVSIKIDGKYPKNVIVDFWGQDHLVQETGEKVDVYFNIKSRVNKKGWVNHTISGYAIRPSADGGDTQDAPAQDEPSQETKEGEQGDLPF